VLFAIEVVLILGALAWLWRALWELERTGEGPRRLRRQRALSGFVLLALLGLARLAEYTSLYHWP
jgi:hypothetical protein